MINSRLGKHGQRDLTVNPSDREPRNQSTRYPEIYILSAEHVPAGQQVTA